MNGGRPNNFQERGNIDQGSDILMHFDKIKNIVGAAKEDYNAITNEAEQIARKLNMNSTKLRKFYNHVKKIDLAGIKDESQVEKILRRELNKFVALMFYDVGRETGKESKALSNFAKGMKNVVENIKIKQGQDIKKSFELFMDFFEALVAFHKYYEKERN
ncbi:type III-A CRISPR-associated protein Csm2 [Fervidobacterium islandicum]|uniref:type III-A CRISPR-associated protein Csm2 n=1 Tax=Fervidobacterium islandicum TaxID=2423 RepID=UPI003A6C056D